MTDINELVLQLKAALRYAHDAWNESDGGMVSLGWLRTATPPAIKLLIEALEASESRLHDVAVACATAEQALEAKDAELNYLRDELHGATAHVTLLKICVNELTREADEKDACIAELQSRAEAAESRTVEIPYLPDDCDRTEAHFKYQSAITAAGIQIQGGE